MLKEELRRFEIVCQHQVLQALVVFNVEWLNTLLALKLFQYLLIRVNFYQILAFLGRIWDDLLAAP